MQSEKKKPGAQTPGASQSPFQRNYDDATCSIPKGRNLPPTIRMGKSPSRKAISHNHPLANRPQLACFGRGVAHMSKRLQSNRSHNCPMACHSLHRDKRGERFSCLHQKGALGVVAYDFRGGPPFRLPAYTWSLMRNHGLVIETRREQHECGWHGRFVLHTPIEIIAIA